MKTNVTLKQIIYNIKNSLNGGDQTDDFKLTDSQFEYIINHFRAKLAAQRLNQGKAYQGFIENLDNIKMVKTDDFRSSVGLTIYRSLNTIPIPINTYKGEALLFVGLLGEYSGYQKTTANNYNIEAYSKYTKYNPKWFYNDGYLYIVCLEYAAAKTITVKGVFENPRDVLATNGIEVEDDYNYPIPMNVLDELDSLIIANELNWINQSPKDLTNNSVDE